MYIEPDRSFSIGLVFLLEYAGRKDLRENVRSTVRRGRVVICQHSKAAHTSSSLANGIANSPFKNLRTADKRPAKAIHMKTAVRRICQSG
jgi:hypothetical protein